MTVAAKLDLALKLLDEVDSTSLSQINAKLDRITDAVAAARRELAADPENLRVITKEQHDAALDAVRELSREPIGASA
jgi:hypothetical protein